MLLQLKSDIEHPRVNFGANILGVELAHFIKNPLA